MRPNQAATTEFREAQRSHDEGVNCSSVLLGNMPPTQKPRDALQTGPVGMTILTGTGIITVSSI